MYKIGSFNGFIYIFILIVSLTSCDDRCGDALDVVVIHNETSMDLKLILYRPDSAYRYNIPKNYINGISFFHPEVQQSIYPDSIQIIGSSTLTYMLSTIGQGQPNHMYDISNWSKHETCKNIAWQYEYYIYPRDFD